jgi:uncharacterized membrane protein YfcA
MFLGWDGGVWALAVSACLVAGVVRGFTGFGFALILVTAVAVLAPPAEIIPISLVLDLFAGLRLLPHVRADVDRRGTVLMVLAALPAIPLGALVLVMLSEEAMRLGIGVTVLIATLAIAAGIGLKRVPGTGLKLATGAAMGMLSGAAGIPGPPLILLYLSSPLPVATLRATAVAVFLAIDAAALAVLAVYGLIDADLLLRCAVLLPLVEIGQRLGHRLYGIAEPAAVKRAALALLLLLAVVAIGRSVF